MFNIIFFLLSITAFILVIGWPVMLLIWALVRKKKTGLFPWKTVIIIAAVMVGGTFLLIAGSKAMLGGIKSNTGMDVFQSLPTPTPEIII